MATGFEGVCDDHAIDGTKPYTDNPPFAGQSEDNIDWTMTKAPSEASAKTDAPPVSSQGPK